jgi:dTDP-4-dehydrorhamnose 3,5-epimerase
MKVIETGIEGLIQIIPTIYSDHRGHFLEFFKSSKFKDLTGGTGYGQDNISFSKKNVLRGLHLQMAPAEQAKPLLQEKFWMWW